MMIILSTDESGYSRQRSKSATLPGIRLGTLTAQIASKSFWNKDMLNEALKQINKTVLAESSRSGSDNERDDEDGNFYTSRTKPITEGAREWKSPCSSVNDDYRCGYLTPPYLSPGITRKLTLTEDMELPFLASQS